MIHNWFMLTFWRVFKWCLCVMWSACYHIKYFAWKVIVFFYFFQDQIEMMIFQFSICVLLFSCWSNADNIDQVLSSKFPKIGNNASSCGGWGRIVKMSQYDKIKHTCYLALRQDELCCIEKPDCPEGLAPEIPVKPYHLYPIKKLFLGCVRPKDRKKKKFRPQKIKVTVCYQETDKKKDGK